MRSPSRRDTLRRELGGERRSERRSEVREHYGRRDRITIQCDDRVYPSRGAMLPFDGVLWQPVKHPSFRQRGRARKSVKAAAQVTALIGAADPIEVIFTSCGTKANAAIRGMLEAAGKRHIVPLRLNIPAVLGCAST